MNYLDANFATALHFSVRGQSEIAERFVRKTSLPFFFSELAELECRRAFLVRTGRPDSENWVRLQSFLVDGPWHLHPLPWKPVSERATEIVNRYGKQITAGTLDTLHVAHATVAGCTWFLSFDTNSNARVLAATCRLKVFPELNAAEKQRLVR